jgi:hypothetical protein
MRLDTIGQMKIILHLAIIFTVSCSQLPVETYKSLQVNRAGLVLKAEKKPKTLIAELKSLKSYPLERKKLKKGRLDANGQVLKFKSDQRSWKMYFDQFLWKVSKIDRSLITIKSPVIKYSNFMGIFIPFVFVVNNKGIAIPYELIFASIESEGELKYKFVFKAYDLFPGEYRLILGAIPLTEGKVVQRIPHDYLGQQIALYDYEEKKDVKIFSNVTGDFEIEID